MSVENEFTTSIPVDNRPFPRFWTNDREGTHLRLYWRQEHSDAHLEVRRLFDQWKFAKMLLSDMARFKRVSASEAEIGSEERSGMLTKVVGTATVPTTFDNYQRVNTNRKVRVCLTPLGHEQYERYLSSLKISADLRERQAAQIADGVWKGQLWELCRIFGPCMYNGSLDVPFVHNQIEISISD